MIIRYFLIIFILFTTSVHAESIYSTVTPKKSQLGDTVRYTIKVVYSKNTKLLSIPPKTLFKSAKYENKLLDYKINKTLKGSLYTLKLHYDIAIFEVGQHQIPPHHIVFSQNNKRKRHTIKPPIITITPNLNPSQQIRSLAKKPTQRLKNLSATVTPNLITIGDKFRYSISFQYPETSKLTKVPSKELFNNADYDIILIDYAINKKRKNKNYHVTIDYDLTLFEVGSFIIPTHNIVLSHANQLEKTPITNQIIKIDSVVAPTQNNMFAFKDIKPLFLTLFPTFSLIKLIGVFLIILCLSISLILYIRKKRQKSVAAPDTDTAEPTDDRPIDIRYIERFNQLKESDFYQNNDHDSFYIELVDILRDYLSERYGKNIFDFTTTEILNYFSSILPEKPMSKLKLVLNSSQLIKFARITPNQEFHSSIIDTCIDIITQTSS